MSEPSEEPTGFLTVSPDAGYLLRLKITTAANLTSDQLRSVAEIADKYGSGTIHLLTRQSLEIPYLNISKEDMDDITKLLSEKGLEGGSLGPTVRNIVVCPGKPTCKNARMITQSLAKKIDEKYKNFENLPMKIKISISGCPNSCSKPSANDIGFMGVEKVVIDSDKCTFCKDCIEDFICPENALMEVNEGIEIDRS
jgi:dissimilatory sulfite reductase (desulfoviridin) alpha/beta subunit